MEVKKYTGKINLTFSNATHTAEGTDKKTLDINSQNEKSGIKIVIYLLS